MPHQRSRRRFLAEASLATGIGLALRFFDGTNGTACVATELPPSPVHLLDELLTGFLSEHRLPGVSVAVGRCGQLLYSRGFGWADVEAQRPVQPDSLFRLASISKSITAVAVMRAVEEGRIALDDKLLPFLGTAVPSEIPDRRWRDITIRHLLQHTAGWDRSKSYDAMFQAVPFAQELKVDPPAQPEHIIQVMLKRPLDFTPGERYAYSNFGYCLLGRVLEHLDGVVYFESVRRRVLCPLGLQRLCLGRTLKEDAHPDEVTYYGAPGATGPSVFTPHVGQPVAWPYGGWNLEAMDAHGGWIGSAPDLVRFAMALDQQARCPILSCDSLKAMWAPPIGLDENDSDSNVKSFHYGLGWMARTDPVNGHLNVWHTGSLDGTSTILVRRHDGFCWAALFNSRHGLNPKSKKFDLVPSTAIDKPMHDAVNATWLKQSQ